MRDGDLTRREFIQRSAAAAAAAGVAAGMAPQNAEAAKEAAKDEAKKKKTRSYDPAMEYRPLGKTGLWISAVCLGGHWKRINKALPGTKCEKGRSPFEQNRYDVVNRCIEAGINYIDACCIQEVREYAKALKGRRDNVYLGCSWEQREIRRANYRTAKALLETLEWGMKDAGIDYVDVWRITMHERSGRHTEGEVQEMMKALETARKQGKVRFTGLSSHDRPHIKRMIETFPQIVQVAVTPYTADSKVLPTDSVFEAVKKGGVGVFGIKPFASNSLFKGDSSADSPHAEEDDRRARLAIRYILCNPAVTAPIPGLISVHQVDNVVRALKERRRLDAAEKAELEQAGKEMWANLPEGYQWLRDWEYV
jgi:aryl-alcohol dehydrogenase-like predicted oxidoreductase